MARTNVTLRRHIVPVLDSIYKCEIQRPVHIMKLIQKWYQQHQYTCIPNDNKNIESLSKFPSLFVSPMLCIPPNIMTNQTSLKQHTELSSCRVQIHDHSFSCHLHHSGKDGCRGNYPQGYVESTAMIRLDPCYDSEHNIIDSYVTTLDNSTDHQDDEDAISIDISMHTEKNESLSETEAKDHNNTTINIDVMERLEKFKYILSHTIRNGTNNTTNDASSNDNGIFIWDLQRRKLDPMKDLSSLLLPSLKLQLVETEILQHLKEELASYPDQQESILNFLHNLPLSSLQSLYSYLQNNITDANLSTVCYNPVFTNIIGSNSANYLLGNTSQSISSLMYIAPYIGKNNVSLMQSMTSIRHANQRMIEKIKQDAQPNNTNNDTNNTEKNNKTIPTSIKFIIEHVLNRLDIQQCEISDMQACSVLLGGTTEVCSDTFGWYNGYDHFKYISQSKEYDAKNIPNDLSFEANDEDEINIERQIYASRNLHGSIYQYYKPKMQKNHADIETKTTNDDPKERIIKKIPYALHYIYRGKALKDLS